jgi:AmmeMemoRadiSam system protein B
MQIRKPAVAGQFYPGKEDSLRKSIEQMVRRVEGKIKAIGIVSPHAGYMYSGPVAGELYSNVEIPETVIVLGPNHTGIGSAYSIMTEGKWWTPIGEVEIESSLAKNILESSKLIEEDSDAHKFEHSLEVQIPFLQYFKKDVKIVPIVLGGINFKEIGESIAKSLKGYKKSFLIVASSDMTHYEPHETAQKKDKLAIDAILKLDEQEMLKKIQDYDISMCGYGPTAIMLIASKILGAKEAKLIKYMTSGDTSGDYSAVVGYAGLAVY